VEGLVWLVPATGIGAVLFAAWLAWDVLRRDTGSKEMQDIAGRIFEGAMAFLKRQYMTIAVLGVIAAVAIGIVLAILSKEPTNPVPGDPSVVEVYDKFGVGWRTAVAFLVGAFCSGLAGFIGMIIAVKANLRTAAGASKGGLSTAVTIAMRAGAVSGFLIVALSLIGVSIIYYAYGGNDNPNLAPFLIVGFGFGASFVALFAQLGGGIYTKAADVGADLVGKVEKGIPEDDPRNAAVIADLVGDNVGDCAGRGADLFESTAAENIGAMILGVAAFLAARAANIPHPEVWVLFPLVLRSFGLIACAVGILSVRAKAGTDPMRALNTGYFVSVGISVIGLAITTWVMMGDVVDNPFYLFLAGIVGLVAGIAIVFITQYYTEHKYSPVKSIANASRTGSATNFLAGFSVGLNSTVATALVVGVGILVAFFLGEQLEFPGSSTLAGVEIPNGGLFGTAVATMSLLMTAAYVLAMDTFGPITDNANGIVEMSGTGGQVREVTDSMDAVGNTTKALTKGYAMGSAGLAAFLLFGAYLDEVVKITGDASYRVVDLSKPAVFVAALFGATLVFLFSALAINAVRKAAGQIIEEVRRQFREIPGIMEGTARPDYARCVDITTRAGLREMVFPGLLVIIVPIIVGVWLKAEAVAAFLMVGTIAGILMATVLNNAGGAWDNAKKFIESGGLKDEKGNTLGKRSEPHAAAVTGDTVGDPFKDTAGPALHVLVKLLATITLVLAPLFI
jgi:K(+)-stimulated pyrophosphate-energized sodium pump